MFRSLLLSLLVLSSIATEEPPQGDVIGEMSLDGDDKANLARRLASNPANPTRMSAAYRDALLKQHNHYRSLTAQGLTVNQPGASYMEELTWDSTLEEMAMAQAQTCVWRARSSLSSEYASRNGPNGQGPIRQSLYQITGWDAGSQRYVVGAVNSWYGKHVGYNYQTGSCGQNCGLYLNIVWASTRFVGCGYQVCNGATIVICNYLKGRTSGKPYPALAGGNTACSGCPVGRRTCSNFLCSGASMGTPTNAPTPKPTMKPTPTLAPTRTGQVAACRGIQVTVGLGMKFGASTSGVTCQDYMAAFTSIFPCVQNYDAKTPCTIANYTGYPGWARVGLKFDASRSVYNDIGAKLSNGQVRNDMRAYLEAKGFKWGTR